MRTYLGTVALVALALLVSACGTGRASGGADPNSVGTDPISVIEASEAAWNAKDLDGVMALLAEDAVETNGLGTFTGKEEIRGVYQDAINWFSQDCSSYQVEGNKVTYDCLLTAYVGTNKTLETYESVVENGKIKSNILIEQIQNP